MVLAARPSSASREMYVSASVITRVSSPIASGAPLGGRRPARASIKASSASLPCWSFSSAGPRRSTIRVTPSLSR